MTTDPTEAELRVIAEAVDQMVAWVDRLPPESEYRRTFLRMREELWRDAGAPLAEWLATEEEE
jgi:hypothetical protein